MVKRVCLLLLSCLVSIMMSPSILTATDNVELLSVSDARTVETVPLPEPEPEVESEAFVETVYAYRASTTAKAPQAGVVVAPVIPNYNVTTYIGSVSAYTASSSNLSYSEIYKYNKMIYGHNTANLLGSLAERYIGETITITEGGVARSYVVSAKIYYNKTSDGNLNNDPHLMRDIANTALGHDLALLTCAGQMLGGGDATQRLVVYIDAI